jgi:LPXTG-motif cell wall-anchored protein
MYFAGRWVPIELMNAFFVLWGIAAVILGGLIWWLRRKKPSVKPKDKPQPLARRRKSRRRKG